MAIVIHRN